MFYRPPPSTIILFYHPPPSTITLFYLHFNVNGLADDSHHDLVRAAAAAAAAAPAASAPNAAAVGLPAAHPLPLERARRRVTSLPAARLRLRQKLAPALDALSNA